MHTAESDDREELKRKTFESFTFYKANRGTNDLTCSNGKDACFKKGARSVEASLESAFQQVSFGCCWIRSRLTVDLSVC